MKLEDDDELIRQLEWQQDFSRARPGKTPGDSGPDSLDLGRLCDLTGGDTGVAYSVDRLLRRPPNPAPRRWTGAEVPALDPRLGPGMQPIYGLIPDVAAALRLKPDTVAKWLKRGKLGGKKDAAKGRPLVCYQDVERLARANRTERQIDTHCLGENEWQCHDRRRSYDRVCAHFCKRCGQDRRVRSLGIAVRLNRRFVEGGHRSPTGRLAVVDAADEPTRARASDGLPPDFWRHSRKDTR
jgi:hypothetical protein